MPTAFTCTCRKNAKGEVLERELSAILQREPCVCPADAFEAAVLADKASKKLVKAEAKAEAAAAKMDTPLEGLLSDEQAETMASEGVADDAVVGVKSVLDMGLHSWLVELEAKVRTNGALRGDDPERISSDHEAQKALAKRIYYSGIRSMQRLTTDILWLALDIGITSHVCSLVG